MRGIICTTTAKIQLVNKELKERKRKNNVGEIFIDLQKAFDCIDWDILVYKLKLLGVRKLSWNGLFVTSSTGPWVIELKSTVLKGTTTVRITLVPAGLQRGVLQKFNFGPPLLSQLY